MKVHEKHIKEVLKVYNINKDVAKIDYICDWYSHEEEVRVRVINKVNLCDKSVYIIKFILEKEHPYELIEEQSRFSEELRQRGIKTARRLKCGVGDRYCYLYSIEDLKLSVTVEEYLGEEIKTLDENIVEEIGIVMAKSHRLSEENKLHINGDTIWNLWNDESDIMRGYLKFQELREEIINLDEDSIEIYENIIEVYARRKNNISNGISNIQRYATQGDYSINNLTYDNGEIGIFDYNIAGDEFLVVDMVIEGIFISKAMDLSEGFEEKDRGRLFDLFIKSYTEVRSLNEEESLIINDLYAIVTAFWFMRIIFDEKESLVSILKDKNIEKLKRFLKETYEVLTLDYFNTSTLN